VAARTKIGKLAQLVNVRTYATLDTYNPNGRVSVRPTTCGTHRPLPYQDDPVHSSGPIRFTALGRECKMSLHAEVAHALGRFLPSPITHRGLPRSSLDDRTADLVSPAEMSSPPGHRLPEVHGRRPACMVACSCRTLVRERVPAEPRAPVQLSAESCAVIARGSRQSGRLGRRHAVALVAIQTPP
jgi:hypothetical protein